ASPTCSTYPSTPRALLLFFFKDPPPTELYTLSLHDALPISENLASLWTRYTFNTGALKNFWIAGGGTYTGEKAQRTANPKFLSRSEEHTSELQSRSDLVCRLLLEKKKKKKARQESACVRR